MHKSWRASRRTAGQNESSPFGVRWSKHAQDRQRQRGVCGEAVIAALAFGEEFADHNHCTTYWLTRRSLVEVPRHALRALWRFIGLAVERPQPSPFGCKSGTDVGSKHPPSTFSPRCTKRISRSTTPVGSPCHSNSREAAPTAGARTAPIRRWSTAQMHTRTGRRPSMRSSSSSIARAFGESHSRTHSSRRKTSASSRTGCPSPGSSSDGAQQPSCMNALRRGFSRNSSLRGAARSRSASRPSTRRTCVLTRLGRVAANSGQRHEALTQHGARERKPRIDLEWPFCAFEVAQTLRSPALARTTPRASPCRPSHRPDTAST